MAEAERPPHPLRAPECHEVKHEEVFQITRVRNIFLLRNVKTNEVHASTQRIKLKFRTGVAFLSKHDGSAVWCKDLMSWSVWSIAGREFVCRKHDHDEVERVWLSDFQKRKQVFYIEQAIGSMEKYGKESIKVP